MAEPDGFHRALAALNPPRGVTELAEQLLLALRLGHDLQVPTAGSPGTWICSRCRAWVWWDGVMDTSVKISRSCLDATREWAARGASTPEALAWLAEHDQEASRG